VAASILLPRRLVGPIKAMQESARLIGAGEYSIGSLEIDKASCRLQTER